MKPLRRILITEYSLVEDIIRDLSTDKNIARDKRRLRRLHRKLVRLSAHVYDETFTVLLHKVIKDFPDNAPVQYEEYEQDLQAMLAYVIKYEKNLAVTQSCVPGTKTVA